MIIRQIWDEKQKSGTGERVLISSQETETTALGYVCVEKGKSTKLGLHNDEEEMYVILKGSAVLMIGDEKQEVGPGCVAYVPRNKKHMLTCISDEKLEYLYFANWPYRGGTR